MKMLDSFDNVKERIGQLDINTILFPGEIKNWLELSTEQRNTKLKRICEYPLTDDDFTVVYTLYFRLKWLDVLKNCISNNSVTVLEVGSGSSANIPCAMSIFDTKSKYITANMNKKLTEGLRHNTSSLPIIIDIIEDDANNINKYLSQSTIDAVFFEHSANDVLQAILCEKNGVDTTNNDWFDILPKMIELINQKFVNQTLEMELKIPFLSLINNCLTVLKHNGCIAMSHYMFQYDLDLGYNAELWQNMIPVIRPWFNDLSIGREVFFKEFDPQWWLFYKKL